MSFFRALLSFSSESICIDFPFQLGVPYKEKNLNFTNQPQSFRELFDLLIFFRRFSFHDKDIGVAVGFGAWEFFSDELVLWFDSFVVLFDDEAWEVACDSSLTTEL